MAFSGVLGADPWLRGVAFSEGRCQWPGATESLFLWDDFSNI